jgi:hypothetical protein
VYRWDKDRGDYQPVTKRPVLHVVEVRETKLNTVRVGGKLRSWFMQRSEILRPAPGSNTSSRSGQELACQWMLIRAFFRLHGPHLLLAIFKFAGSSAIPSITNTPAVVGSLSSSASPLSTPGSVRGSPVASAAASPSSVLSSSSLMESDSPLSAPTTTNTRTDDERYATLLIEIAMAITVRCYHLLRRPRWEACQGDFTYRNAGDKDIPQPAWWNDDIVARIIQRTGYDRPIGKDVIRALFSLLIGEPRMTLVQLRQMDDSGIESSTSGSFVEDAYHLLPVLVFALSRTTLQIAKNGLENLHMMLLRNEGNASGFLAAEAWQQWFASLLNGNATSHDDGTNDHYNGNIHGQSVSLDKDAALRTYILQLSVSTVVLLFYRHFNDDPLSHARHDDGRCKPMATVLTETIDILEDFGGWGHDTVALVRVMLSSLMIRITTGLNTFVMDPTHHSWTALFDIFAVMEDFLFFRPIEHPPTAAELATIAKLKIATSSANDTKQRARKLSVHMSSAGTCEDVPLLKKVIAALDKMKINDMDESADLFPNQDDRNAMRRLKKKLTNELAFFNDVTTYFSAINQAQKDKVAAAAGTPALSVTPSNNKPSSTTSGLDDILKKLTSQLSDRKQRWTKSHAAMKRAITAAAGDGDSRDRRMVQALHSLPSAVVKVVTRGGGGGTTPPATPQHHQRTQSTLPTSGTPPVVIEKVEFVSQTRARRAFATAEEANDYLAAKRAATTGPTLTFQSQANNPTSPNPSTAPVTLTFKARGGVGGTDAASSAHNRTQSSAYLDAPKLSVATGPSRPAPSTIGTTPSTAPLPTRTIIPTSTAVNATPIPSSTSTPILSAKRAPVKTSSPGADSDIPPPPPPMDDDDDIPPPPPPDHWSGMDDEDDDDLLPPPPLHVLDVTSPVLSPRRVMTPLPSYVDPSASSINNNNTGKRTSTSTTTRTSPASTMILPPAVATTNATTTSGRPPMVPPPKTTNTAIPSKMVSMPPKITTSTSSSSSSTPSSSPIPSPASTPRAGGGTGISVVPPSPSSSSSSAPHTPSAGSSSTTSSATTTPKSSNLTIPQQGGHQKRRSLIHKRSPTLSAAILEALTQQAKTPTSSSGNDHTNTANKGTLPNATNDAASQASLSCADCHGVIDLSNFYEVDGRVYCERDYIKLYCSCASCDRAMEANQPYVSFAGRSDDGIDEEVLIFHPSCFKCYHCQLPFNANQALHSNEPKATDGGMID